MSAAVVSAVALTLSLALVAGTLLGGPIGTGNLYLTKVGANGGVDAPAAAPVNVCLGTGSTVSSRSCGCDCGCDNPTLLLGNVKKGSRSSTTGVSKRLVKRTGVGI